MKKSWNNNIIYNNTLLITIQIVLPSKLYNWPYTFILPECR